MSRAINCQVGIYDTSYKLTCHRDKSVTVRAPFIRWTKNSGALAFDRVKIKSVARANFVKRFFEDDTLVIDDDGLFLTLDDVIYGRA
jgi:hypothetical protein